MMRKEKDSLGEIEVEKEKQREFEKTLKDNKTFFVKIGEIKSNKLVIKDNCKKIINKKICNLRDIWKNTICNIMG